MTPPVKKSDSGFVWVPPLEPLSEPKVGPFSSLEPAILPPPGQVSLSAPYLPGLPSKFGGAPSARTAFPQLWSPSLHPFSQLTPQVLSAWPIPAQLGDPNASNETVIQIKDPEGYSQVWAELNGHQENETEKLVEFFAQLLNNVLALDLDFENLPVNRGSGLTRFPEYDVKAGPKQPPNIKIRPGTTARAHGEMRPIKGIRESWITRVGWDFHPNVYYEDKARPALPNLEIDGATAVDPPAMKFDFSKGRKSVLSMSGGNYSYENPQVAGGPMRTPFNAIVDPPPDNHNYWMFRFNPAADNALAGLMETVSDGKLDPLFSQGMGALLLWAYLPTVGIVNPKHYQDLHIPPNTFPRRLGDLIKLLNPLFDAELAENHRQAGPFYNPNTEFVMPYIGEKGELRPFPKKWRDIIDINEKRKNACEANRLQGKNDCLPLIGRQPIPDDPKELQKIDAIFDRLGLTRIPRKRGTIIDWAFIDIAKDPARLKATKALPRAVLHLRMRTTTLDTPFGKVKVDPNTDIKIYYHIFPVQNSVTGRIEGRIGLRVDIEPLKLENVDWQIASFSAKADLLKAKKLVLQIPSIPGISQEDPTQRPPWTFSLEGVEAKNLNIWDAKQSFNLKMVTGNIGNIRFAYQEDWKAGTLREWKNQAPTDFDPAKCKYANEKRDMKYGCYYQTPGGEWKNYTPQEYTGIWELPDDTRVVYNREGIWKIDFQTIGGTGLELDSAAGKLNMTQFDIPEVHLAATYERREKLDFKKRPFEKNEIHFLSLNIPEIKTNLGLEMKLKDTATSVALKGSSVLKNFKYFSENQEKRIHTSVNLDLSGIVESAELSNLIFGSAKFSTQEDPEHIHKISGKLRSSSIRSREDPTEKPVVNFDLDLDLPYVGFESRGILNIPSGSSTLRKAHLNLSADPDLKVKLSGHMNLKEASHRGTEALEFGRFQLTPNITHLNASGDFTFEFSPKGFSLKPAEGSSEPLQISGDLDGSKFNYRHDLENHWLADKPQSKIIETDLALQSAKVRIKGLHGVEVSRVTEGEVTRNKIVQLDAGPITIHHIEGSGSIWAPLPIWDYVRGFFPWIGNMAGKEKAKRPNAARLTEHLPEDEKKELRELVGDGDFVHFGKLQRETAADGKWNFRLNDLMIDLHENGGREQFVLIRLPELGISNKYGFPRPDLGKGNFLANIFLFDPQRGGFFRMYRPTPKWWEKGK